MIPCLYLNEKADPDLKRVFEIEFPDVPRVSADYINELIGGGLADDGPGLATYAAAIIDENGELSLFEQPPRDA
jgi:hypothetical protein